MQSLLHDIVVVYPMKLLTSNVRFLFAIILTLVCLAAWQYRNFMKKYAGLPAYSLLTYLIYAYALRKFPRNLPFTSFIFQKLITICKQFEYEGMCIIWIGKPVLFIYGEKSIKIFGNEQSATDKSAEYEVLKDVFGNGLVTSNGEIWRTRRKLLNPIFHMGSLKGKLDIFNKQADMLVKRLSSIEDKTSIDIHQYLKCTAFDTMWEYIMGTIPSNHTFRNRFLELVEKLSEVTVFRMCHPWFHPKIMLHFMPSGRNILHLYAEGQSMIDKLVLDVKKHVLESKYDKEDSENSNRKSFTHVLIEQHLKDPSFTLQDINKEIVTFIAAGFDTISYSILWCLFLLGHHPDVQEQVFNEIESLSGEHVTYGDFNNLKYLECVIKESLRLYTTIPLHARRTNNDVQCGKYLVPKGTDIVFFPYLLHRDPTIFPEPEKFIPERFLEAKAEKLRSTFVSFSEGIRNCIGKKFAMVEMMVIITHILRNFKVTSLESRENVNLAWNIVLLPIKPLHLQVTPRNYQHIPSLI